MIAPVHRAFATITPVLPREIAVHDGLAYSLWLPEAGRAVRGGVVILHGAGSCKESHHDYARAAGGRRVRGDLRSTSGATARATGAMDGRAIEDIVAMAALLRSRIGDPGRCDGAARIEHGRLLRADVGCRRRGAQAVVAICPAEPRGLQRGIEAGTLRLRRRRRGAFGAAQRCGPARRPSRRWTMPVLLLHAEGDEQVPVEHSRELATRFASPPQPPDRRPRRPSPLGAARRGAAGGEPEVHPARVRVESDEFWSPQDQNSAASDASGLLEQAADGLPGVRHGAARGLAGLADHASGGLARAIDDARGRIPGA